MATDKWLQFDGTEIVNLSRTAQLAETLGIDSVWTMPDTVQWVEDARSGLDYEVIANAPWYDDDYPASAEFAGVVPLGFPGLDDSTTEASTQEYINDGGRSGSQRNATLPIVASVAFIASTDRGAEYGKNWLSRVLKRSQGCAGVDLHYYAYSDSVAPLMHRRQVRLTRGMSITRKRSVECSVTWLATFTLTCDDPYEYGEPVAAFTGMGDNEDWTPGLPVFADGTLALTQQSCPVYNYTPVYDPLHPALIPSPVAPDFFPAGWDIAEGMVFDRFWARVHSPEPHTLNVVPYLSLTTDSEARMVRVSIWPSDSLTSDQCDPLFSAVVSYLPTGSQFVIDGEQKAAYIWDGFSPNVRRADSLVYSPDAKPVVWTAFNDPISLLVTLDVFTEGSGFEGDGTVRLAASFIPKSD